MIGLIAIVVLAGIAAPIILAARKPNHFRTARETVISAPPETIFNLINDFHAWTQWSPYEKLDAAMLKTYDGAASGVGAGYAWSGAKTGEGRMTIIESVAPTKIVIALAFTKPMKANNTAEFTLEPQNDAVRVVWAMSGAQPFMMKLMTLVCDMDGLVGKDFEAGLANLKGVAEA